MKRVNRHKIKKEVPETSTSRFRDQEEHDLAYYIHDRVELMHQVFSVIRAKELKAMAPECVQHISIDDLQELCAEELLGISSKRLCAILDGADPPTDTESSSSEHMETISLESISSDDEILSQPSCKKKHKHKKHKSKNKHKRKDSNGSNDKDRGDEDRSKASRAGLTVLELLELQARARAIRAQLQQDNANMPTEIKKNVTKQKDDSSDEVEIKEEPAEVVEISSEDEKPRIEDLPVQSPSPSKENGTSVNSKAATKTNDLIVIVPSSKSRPRIKLNRNKNLTFSSGSTEHLSVNEVAPQAAAIQQAMKVSEIKKNKEQTKAVNDKSKPKRKQKKKGKKPDKEGSDHDEITLQLSDTEKMDLLEDLDRKNYENFTSSSEDSGSSSETDSENNTSKDCSSTNKQDDNSEKTTSHAAANKVNKKLEDDFCAVSDEASENNKKQEARSVGGNGEITVESDKNAKHADEETLSCSSDNANKKINPNIDIDSRISSQEINITLKENQQESPLIIEPEVIQEEKLNESAESNSLEVKDSVVEIVNKSEHLAADTNDNTKESIEEGEITDREEIQYDKAAPDVVCISDEEDEKRKKKKKKGKKSKKEKKSKSDFREGADQNFFRNDTEKTIVVTVHQTTEKREKQQVDDVLALDDDDDDIYEILELSDDSSCYEVEGISVSKAPTAAEIEALSAKIDEIKTDDTVVITEDDTVEDTSEEKGHRGEVESISWRDRYLGSRKVKRVLTTSNILNALRKKNKELKKKLEQSKRITEEVTGSDEVLPPPTSDYVEGSIEHFNTLEGSSKYVDPVPEGKDGEEVTDGEVKGVTKEMEKDAKQLLKMYKRLLKYNDMKKKKDTSKKKKKKHKKNKEKHSEANDNISQN